MPIAERARPGVTEEAVGDAPAVSEPQQGPRCALCHEAGGAANVCDYCGGARRPAGYRALSIVAQSSYSRVYEAVDDAGVRVAVKELLFARVPGAKELEDFEREARVLSELDHPRIPRIVKFLSEGRGVNTRLYIVQQFVEGQALTGARLDEEGARVLARELLPVLGYLHSRVPPIVHRDVKPANLIRRPDGSHALVDFGAARDLTRGETFGATLVGTFGYMPLEQLGGTVDPTADLYAFGMTLIHLLSGHSPAELVDDQMRIDARAAVACSKAFEDWLAKLTAPRREDRFQTASQALTALELKQAEPERPAHLRDTKCACCGAEVRASFACPTCDAALLPAGLVPERMLSKEKRTYLARDGGKLKVVREQLLADVDEVALAEHVKRLEQLEFPAGVLSVERVAVAGPPGDRRLFIVRDYVAGASLDELPRSPQLTLEVATRLFELLSALHRREPPVLLGDLRPSNIIYTPEGEVVVTDVRASAQLPAELARQVEKDELTDPLLPPERRSGVRDASCDVYAASVSLLTLLEPPHPLSNNRVKALRDSREGTFREVGKVLRRLTEPNRGVRLLSADHALLALGRARPKSQAKAAPAAKERALQRAVEEGEPPLPEARSFNPTAVALVSASLLAIALAGYNPIYLWGVVVFALVVAFMGRRS